MNFIVLVLSVLIISIGGTILVIKNENKKDKILLEKRNDKIHKEFIELSDKEKRKLEYKEYLESDHWQDIRSKALERADNKCQLCSSKINLNVHHNTYKNRGNENLTDLVVLCRECHAKFHNKLP